MNRGKQPKWTLEQRQAVVAAIRDIVGTDHAPRARECIAIAEQVLGPHPQTGAPEQSSVLNGDPAVDIVFVALAVAACMRSDALTKERAERVQAHARAMGVVGTWPKVLRHMANGRGHRVTMALARHAPDGKRVLQAAWKQRGLLAVFDALRSLLGTTRPEPETGWYYRQLGLLPDGTVGRALWVHLTERKIALPGEAGGLPESAVHHDLVHTLTGYGTDPAGECEIGGFYAGMLYPGWPSWILAGLATFELGLRVGPSFTEPTRGAFDPRRVWSAIARGHRSAFSPLEEWDHRALMDRPLPEARAALGI